MAVALMSSAFIFCTLIYCTFCYIHTILNLSDLLYIHYGDLNIHVLCFRLHPIDRTCTRWPYFKCVYPSNRERCGTNFFYRCCREAREVGPARSAFFLTGSPDKFIGLTPDFPPIDPLTSRPPPPPPPPEKNP
jgi:hypothetical protein